VAGGGRGKVGISRWWHGYVAVLRYYFFVASLNVVITTRRIKYLACLTAFVCLAVGEDKARDTNGCPGYMVLFFIASGVGLSSLYCGHFWPIVPVTDDR
jgi:hypothetical protein